MNTKRCCGCARVHVQLEPQLRQPAARDTSSALGMCAFGEPAGRAGARAAIAPVVRVRAPGVDDRDRRPRCVGDDRRWARAAGPRPRSRLVFHGTARAGPRCRADCGSGRAASAGRSIGGGAAPAAAGSGSRAARAAAPPATGARRAGAALAGAACRRARPAHRRFARAATAPTATRLTTSSAIAAVAQGFDFGFGAATGISTSAGPSVAGARARTCAGRRG